MAIDRTTILRGPATVKFTPVASVAGNTTPITFYTKDDVAVDFELDTFKVETAQFGEFDRRLKNRVAKVRFTPAGEWEGLSSMLSAYSTLARGTSIFGSGAELLIQGIDGRSMKFTDSAVTKMPDLDLSSTKTLFTSMEFTAINKNNTAWSAANSLATDAALTHPTHNLGSIATVPMVVTWAAGFTGFQTKDGFKVSFNLQTEEFETDTDGIVDYAFKEIEVVARCIPVGPTAAQLLAALQMQETTLASAAVVRGQSFNTIGTNLVIAGAPVSVTLNKCALRSAKMQWGAVAPRIGEVEFVATRSVIGTPDALYTLASI